jgi:voltage-gated hydrogen channel 1
LADLAYTLLSPECEPSGAPDNPAWLEVLSLISTTITTLFLVEIPLALWSFGREFYNPFGRVPHASFHLFDAIIILTTFVLEVILKGKERELAGLLITLRLWRLLKLVGGKRPRFCVPDEMMTSKRLALLVGVAVGAGEIDEDTYRELARVQRELEEVRLALTQAHDESQALRERVAWLESQAPTLTDL